MSDSTQIVKVATASASPIKYGNAKVTPALRAVPRDEANKTKQLLVRIFRDVRTSIALRLWDGTTLVVGSTHADERQQFTLAIRDPNVVSAMMLRRDPLYLAEAYFCGDIDIEGDFFAAVSLKDKLESIHISIREKMHALMTALQLRIRSTKWLDFGAHHQLRTGSSVRSHSKAENKDAIQFHYDVSNDFYSLWLDDAMVYSCAYFEHENADLHSAQRAKLDHICRKLLLKENERLLDIGCGWGALVIHAAQHYGVHAHGVTLSPQQLTVARQRIAQAGLEDRVTVELRDYRDLHGSGVYDKIASVGMFEHVGLKNLPIYFSTVHRLLKPAGLFLNHGITHNVEGWNKTLSTEFINRYVFPDGQLDTIGNVQRSMERAGFEIADVEALRAHYALTLRHWVARLEDRHAQALNYVSEATYRVWRLYMAACALDFECGDLGVYQVVAGKCNAEPASIPLTRRHLYA